MNSKETNKRNKKQFLGIHFKCCNIYSRIYKNKRGTAYEGLCLGCKRVVFVPIGKEGTNSRFFIAD
jgi:hypothetical protein